jgi:hypothetical protein
MCNSFHRQLERAGFSMRVTAGLIASTVSEQIAACVD